MKLNDSVLLVVPVVGIEEMVIVDGVPAPETFRPVKVYGRPGDVTIELPFESLMVACAVEPLTKIAAVEDNKERFEIIEYLSNLLMAPIDTHLIFQRHPIFLLL